MTPFLLCVSAYACWHAGRCAVAMWRDTCPRQCSLGLYGLGLWSCYLLVA